MEINLNKICSALNVSAEKMLASYAIIMLELYNQNSTKYWKPFDEFFDIGMINEYKKMGFSDDFIEGYELATEFEFCKDVCNDEEIKRSKEAIVNKFVSSIEK